MEFLQGLVFGDVLQIAGEQYLVCRTWNGKTVQVRRRGVKHSQSLRPSEIEECVELYNPKYGYTGKVVADIVKEPFNVANQWSWDNTFTLIPVAYTTPASAENDPSLPPIPPSLLG